MKTFAAHLRPHQVKGVQFLYECLMGMRGIAYLSYFNYQSTLISYFFLQIHIRLQRKWSYSGMMFLNFSGTCSLLSDNWNDLFLYIGWWDVWSLFKFKAGGISIYMHCLYISTTMLINRGLGTLNLLLVKLGGSSQQLTMNTSTGKTIQAITVIWTLLSNFVLFSIFGCTSLRLIYYCIRLIRTKPVFNDETRHK
jgi:hypothetical protein